MLTKIFTLIGISLLFSHTLFAATLQENVIAAIQSNPLMQEKLKNIIIMHHDKNDTQTDYYAKTQLYYNLNEMNSGEDDSNNLAQSISYKNYKTSLASVRGFYNGLEDSKKEDVLEAYRYLENSNQIAFEMTKVYLDVLSSDEMLSTAKENLQNIERVHTKVKDLIDIGVMEESELKELEMFLSLASSSLAVQKNKAYDSQLKYKRVLGHKPEVDKMKKPSLNIKVPDNLKTATQYAMKNKPSFLIKENHPKSDLKISINKINGQVKDLKETRDEVIKGLDTSLKSNEMLEIQLKNLKEYDKLSHSRLEQYKKEYILGKRSLLDFISALNDITNSRTKAIMTEYKQLLAKYQILDLTGLLMIALNETEDEYTAQLKLDSDTVVGKTFKSAKVEQDGDNDGILDSKESCKDAPKGFNIDEKGCVISKTMRLDFPQNSSYFPKKAIPEIRKFAKFLKENPQYKIKIVGHTSSEGVKEYNRWLSRKRAYRIMKGLAYNGIDISRMSIEGRGEAELLVDDSTLEGMKVNRRIEIEIIR